MDDWAPASGYVSIEASGRLAVDRPACAPVTLMQIGVVNYVTGGLLDVFYEITEKSRLHVTLQSCDQLTLYGRSYAYSSRR